MMHGQKNIKIQHSTEGHSAWLNTDMFCYKYQFIALFELRYPVSEGDICQLVLQLQIQIHI